MSNNNDENKPKKMKHIRVPHHENSMDFDEVPTHDSYDVTDNGTDDDESNGNNNKNNNNVLLDDDSYTGSSSSSLDLDLVNGDDNDDGTSNRRLEQQQQQQQRGPRHRIFNPITPDKVLKSFIDRSLPGEAGKQKFLQQGSRWDFGNNLTLVEGTIYPILSGDVPDPDEDKKSNKDGQTAFETGNPLFTFKMFYGSINMPNYIGEDWGDWATQLSWRIIEGDGSGAASSTSSSKTKILNLGKNIEGDARLRDGHYYWHDIQSAKDIERHVVGQSFARLDDEEFLEDDDPKLVQAITKYCIPFTKIDETKYAMSPTIDYFPPEVLQKKSVERVSASHFAKEVIGKRLSQVLPSDYEFTTNNMYFMMEAIMRNAPVQRRFKNKEEEKAHDYSAAAVLAMTRVTEWFLSDEVGSDQVTPDFDKCALQIKF